MKVLELRHATRIPIGPTDPAMPKPGDTGIEGEHSHAVPRYLACFSRSADGHSGAVRAFGPASSRASPTTEPRADRAVLRPARRAQAGRVRGGGVHGGEHRAELDSGARCGRRASCATNPRDSGPSAASVTLCRTRARAAHLRGRWGRMSSDMHTDLPGSALDRSELLDVLRRTMDAAGIVLAPTGIVGQSAYDLCVDTDPKKELLHLGGGHARIYGPDGRSLAAPLDSTEEGVLYASTRTSTTGTFSRRRTPTTQPATTPARMCCGCCSTRTCPAGRTDRASRHRLVRVRRAGGLGSTGLRIRPEGQVGDREAGS